MDRRSWLWRRKSSETESSGSVSSHSERFSEDQEGMRASSVNASPNNSLSPEISSKLTVYDPNETIKNLNEKLSAALLSISAKEELVQQHIKVAEEAVSGWEKAEADVAALKKQLEVVLQKNSALEDRAKQLDAALKECVRQLRQSREEQEQSFCETITKRTKEWETEKFELETQIIELRAKIKLRAESASSIDHQVCVKLQELEKEMSALQIELIAKAEDLHLRTLERDLSTQAAETASKLHLESSKKLARVEAECRRLRAANRKSSPLNDHIKPSCGDQRHPSSVYAVSLADSQSDSGDRLNSLDNESCCSDSWAAVLIQRNLTASNIKIDLMDDFLEMERLAALPEAGHESSRFDIDGDSCLSVARDDSSKIEIEDMSRQLAVLKQKISKFEAEKVELELALSESRGQLKVSCEKLIIADNKLIELQEKLSEANGSKLLFEAKREALDSKRKELESQLESSQLEIRKLNERASLLEGNIEKEVSEKFESKVQEMESLAFQLKMEQLEIRKLHASVSILEKEVDEERKLSSEYLTRCQDMETFSSKSMELETQLMLATREVTELHTKVYSLEVKLKEEEDLSAKLAANMEDAEENRKKLSTVLEAANAESVKLKERIRLLEDEVEEKRTLAAELAAKCENLQSQLSSTDFEVRKLHEKVSLLENILDEERASLTEFQAQAEASMEAKKIAWESQITLTQTEIEELGKKANLLEIKVEEERTISAGLAVSKEELETQLELAHLEVQRLRDKASSMYAEQSIKQQDNKLMLRKEKDVVIASDMFAACQKTIDSISQQLKSLSNFENLMLESEKCEAPSSSIEE